MKTIVLGNVGVTSLVSDTRRLPWQLLLNSQPSAGFQLPSSVVQLNSISLNSSMGNINQLLVLLVAVATLTPAAAIKLKFQSEECMTYT